MRASPVLTRERPARIRVLVVDERAVVREGLRLILGMDPVFEVIATVGHLESGIAVARETDPDVILAELQPGTPAGDLVRALHQALPQARIVIVTDLAEGDAVAVALREGATAYLLKDATADEVRSTIRCVALDFQGRRTAVPISWDPVPEDPGRLLTPRERQVLARIAEGKPNRVIAGELGITSETVKTYVKRILGKLRVESRTEAAVLALTTGLVHALPTEHPRTRQRPEPGDPRP